MKPDWGKGYTRKAQALHRAGDDRGAMMTYQEGLEKCPADEALKKAAFKLQGQLNAKMSQQLFTPDYMEKLKSDSVTRKYLEEDANFVQMVELMRTQPMLLGQLIQSEPRCKEVFRVLSGIPASAAFANADNGSSSTPAPARPRQTRAHWAPKPKESSDADEKKKEDEEEEEEKKPEVDPEVQAIRDKANALKEEGNALYKSKKFNEAIAKYEEASATDPTNMSYLLNIGSAQMGLKNFAACVASCEKALEIAAEHGGSFESKAKAFGRIGKAYMRQKKWEDAVKAFEAGLLEADDKQIVKNLKKARRELKKAQELAYLDPEKALEAKEKGNELFRAGKFVESIPFYTDAIKRDPKCAVYYMNRAAAYTKLMDFERGLADSEKGLELDPSNAKGFYRKGKIEIMLKKYNRALDSFRAGLKAKPGDKACTLGLQEVSAKIQAESSSGKNQEERAREAMKDPEIQAIMSDPVMRSVLGELSDPAKMRHHMANADIRAKIEKLYAAGIIGGQM